MRPAAPPFQSWSWNIQAPSPSKVFASESSIRQGRAAAQSNRQWKALRYAMRASPAVHVFAFADSAHPNLCTLASSVASAGGSLNVVGLGYDEEMPFGAVPREALDSIAEALAEQGKAKQVEGQRMAATLQCMTKEDCKKTKGLKKVRKFFAVWPHLEHLEDEDLVLAMDGYDVVLETPSLEHLQDTFDHVQRRLGPVTSLPTGPVIFSGEANCWPFVHPWTEPPFMTGDYRPHYLYRYGAGHALRGDKVCEHWRKHLGHPGKMPGHRFGRNRTEELPLFLPFLNSGVFMGRVASLRGLFALAAEVLRLFGDFADQALVTSTALHASLLERPWVPLRVDHTGELLASLHGVQLEALARRLKAPPVCNFPGRMDHGFYTAAAGQPGPGRSKWSSARLEAERREDRPPPLVVHFNGDKKPYFEENCHDSVSAEGQVLGSVPGQCSLMDTDHQMEAFITTPSATETRVHMRQVLVPALARTPPHVASRLLGISVSLGLNTAREVAGRLLSHGQSILVHRPGPPNLPTLTWSASNASSWRLGARRCLGEVELWQFDVRGPQDGKLPTPEHLQKAQEGHQALGAVLLDSESMACANRPFQQDYCQMLFELRASWSCLAPHGENSSGLMLAIYDPADFQDWRSTSPKSLYLSIYRLFTYHLSGEVLQQLQEANREVTFRLERREKGGRAGSSTAGSTMAPGETQRKPALIIGRWDPDQEAALTKEAATDILRSVEAPIPTDGMFVPGVRRGYAILPIDDRVGESFEQRRQRIQEVIAKEDPTRSHPALFVGGLAGHRKLLEEKPTAGNFQATAGLSVGGITALTAAGVFSFSDGLSLVLERAKAVQEVAKLQDQATVSVSGLDEPKVQDLCRKAVEAAGSGEVCQVSGYLHKRGLLVGGTKLAMEGFQKLAKSARAMQVTLCKAPSLACFWQEACADC
eukprot:s632_g4.t1